MAKDKIRMFYIYPNRRRDMDIRAAWGFVHRGPGARYYRTITSSSIYRLLKLIANQQVKVTAGRRIGVELKRS